MKKLALFALFAFSAPVFGMEIHASQIFTLAGNIAYKRFEGPRDVQDAREFLDISNKRRCFVIKVVPGHNPKYFIVGHTQPLWLDESTFREPSAAASASEANFGAGFDRETLRKAFGGSEK